MEQQIEGQGAAAQTFAYEIREDSAVILRCFSRDVRAEIPEYLEGYPVTEVAPYAFSGHFEDRKLQEELRAGRARLYVPEAMRFGDGQEYAHESIWPGGAPALCGGRLEEIVLPPALCGSHLEEIVLPPTLRRVGRYCFYDCGNLRRIEFHGALSDWGSGAFTGCHHVRELCVFTDEAEQSHLKDVLDELREELETEYYVRAGSAPGTEGSSAVRSGRQAVGRTGSMLGAEGSSAVQPGGQAVGRTGSMLGAEGSSAVRPGRQNGSTPGEAARPRWEPVRLIFPEFYEEGVENTPARILETHVHGSGILYRNCFRGRMFDFAQYDALFPYARAWESEELVIRMALWRLRSGYGLTAEAAARYRAYVAEHARQAGTWLLGRRDLDGLRFLLALVQVHRSVPETDGAPRASRGQVPHGDPAPSGMPDTLLSYLLENASGMHYMEAVSFLMEQTRGEQKARPATRRRFEL